MLCVEIILVFTQPKKHSYELTKHSISGIFTPSLGDQHLPEGV